MTNKDKMPDEIWAWVPYKGCGHGYFLDTNTVDKPISSKYTRADKAITVEYLEGLRRTHQEVYLGDKDIGDNEAFLVSKAENALIDKLIKYMGGE